MRIRMRIQNIKIEKNLKLEIEKVIVGTLYEIRDIFIEIVIKSFFILFYFFFIQING